MDRKKVLVCGATGFIGRNVAERFARRPEFEVYGTSFKSKPLEIDGINMVYVDLRDAKSVDELVRGKDIVIQMAATTSGAKDIITRPYLHVTDNAVMNSLLLRSSFENGVKNFIFPSCTVVYGSSPVPVKETDYDERKMAKNYFGVGSTKVYVEKMCEFFAGLGRTKHTVIRHSNIYGPYDKFDLEKSHVFGATVNKVMSTLPGKKGEEGKKVLTVWGDGSERRDLLYIDDLVDFIETAVDRQTAQHAIYNVGCGDAVSIDELVRRIMGQAGSPAEIRYDLSKPTIKTELALDISKVKDELGWEPKISLREGIERTLKWYKENAW